LWNTFCAQLGCTPAFTEKAAGRFAFFLGNGTVEPDFTQDRDKPYTFSAQTLPAIFRAQNVEMERVTAIGIPPILLAIASGVGITEDYKLVQNPQPLINRPILVDRVKIMNQEQELLSHTKEGIIESYLNSNSNSNLGGDQVALAFVPFIMEPIKGESEAHAALPDYLQGNAMARLITKADIDHLQHTFLVTLDRGGDEVMTEEQRLHLVFQAITKRFNGFQKKSDLELLLHLLLGNAAFKTSKQDQLDAAAFHCWGDTREVIYFTKLAWVALKLPCLGAMAGNARMYACTHALLGIKATLRGGPPYVEIKEVKEVNGEQSKLLSAALTQQSTPVEFYYAMKDIKPVSFFDSLQSVSYSLQYQVTSSSSISPKELLVNLVYRTAIEPSTTFGFSEFLGKSMAIERQILRLIGEINALNCTFLESLWRLQRNTMNKKGNKEVEWSMRNFLSSKWKKYFLGPSKAVTFDYIQQARPYSNQIYLFAPLIGLLIENPPFVEAIPSPHKALIAFISNNGLQANEKAQWTPIHSGIPMFPTENNDKALRAQLKWMRGYLGDLLHPIVTFLTQWLCNLCLNPASLMGKDMVCQWVWAFVWELLDHCGGPYISISHWMNDPNPARYGHVRNLLDICSLEELKLKDRDNVFFDPRIPYLQDLWDSIPQHATKALRSNLFGIVVYLIYNIELQHFTLSNSCRPDEEYYYPDPALGPSIYTVCCPRFQRKDGDGKWCSLFQMTKCLLEDTDDARQMADRVNTRLQAWAKPPCVVLERLFAAVPGGGLTKNSKADPNRKAEITAAMLRLVLGWWIPPEEDTSISSNDDLYELLDKHIHTALGLDARGSDNRLLTARLKEFADEMKFVVVDPAEDRPSDTEDDTPKPAKVDNKADSDFSSGTEEDRPKPAKKKKKLSSSQPPEPGPAKAGTKESEEPAKKKPKLSSSQPFHEDPADESTGKKNSPVVEDPPAEDAGSHPFHAKAGTKESQKEKVSLVHEDPTDENTGKKNSPVVEDPPAEDAGSHGIGPTDLRWKRLGVHSWVPASRVFPDPNLHKEILLMPSLDVSAPAESGESTVQFRKLTLDTIECYICDFVPKIHLKAMLKFHRSKAFTECYSNNSALIDPFGVRDTKEEDVQYRHYSDMQLDQREKLSHGRYFPYYSKYKGDQSYWYDQGFEGAHEGIRVVDEFMDKISKGVKKVIKEESKIETEIEFKEMHGVAITTTHDAFHQRAHLDHCKAYDKANDSPEKRAYIGHMPLQSEGMVLRLDNPTKKMLNCLNAREEGDATVVLNNSSEVVEDHLYLHIPFGSILLIDDRTFHGGHYGTAAKHRFHFVLSPYDWSPWNNVTRRNPNASPKSMKKADKEHDSLLFLIQAARLYTPGFKDFDLSRIESSKTKKVKGKADHWDTEKDPQVALPKLDIKKNLDLSEISNMEEYWKKRGSFYKAIAEELFLDGVTEARYIRRFIDNY
jgi:hypothetical protein